jgi:hypothetical protein
MQRFWIRPMVIVLVGCLVLAQLRFASRHTVFLLGHGERRFAVAARLTEQVTEPNSVVIALTHSGSIRYYGERMTMNFSQMERESLDEAVEWLQQRGIKTYATLEDWELKEFKQRFADARHLIALERAPRGIFGNPGEVRVFELSDSETALVEPLVMTDLDIGWRAIPPGPPPRLVVRQDQFR